MLAFRVERICMWIKMYRIGFRQRSICLALAMGGRLLTSSHFHGFVRIGRFPLKGGCKRSHISREDFMSLLELNWGSLYYIILLCCKKGSSRFLWNISNVLNGKLESVYSNRRLQRCSRLYWTVVLNILKKEKTRGREVKRLQRVEDNQPGWRDADIASNGSNHHYRKLSLVPGSIKQAKYVEF